MADLYIHNQWKEGHGEPFVSHNPASGEIAWSGLAASSEDVDAAIKAAAAAFEGWSRRSYAEREDTVKRFGSLLEERSDTLAHAISVETGKPRWEAAQEVKAMISKIGISIEAYALRCPNRTFAVGQAQSVTRHRPHGVAAVFGPFNFPGHLPNGHIVPALLAGNTIVFKPSEYTPLCAEIMTTLWEKTDFPKGVLNMIQGGRKTGQYLATHPDIDALFFTGSWSTGLWLSEHFAKHPEKLLALELGGNNPLVVSDFADLEAAVMTTLQSAYITAGQRCTCVRRLIVIENPTNKQFIERLCDAIPKIHIGAFTDNPEPFMGPVISKEAAAKLLEVQASLIQKGAKPLVEMKLLKPDTPFVTPGLIDVTEVADKIDAEYFGPLLQIIRVADLQKAVDEANNTAYGLTAGILTQNRSIYEYFLDHAKAGVINWNMPLTGANSGAPFGGIGRSGNHRPSALYAADYCSYPVASLEATTIPPTHTKILIP